MRAAHACDGAAYVTSADDADAGAGAFVAAAEAPRLALLSACSGQGGSRDSHTSLGWTSTFPTLAPSPRLALSGFFPLSAVSFASAELLAGAPSSSPTAASVDAFEVLRGFLHVHSGVARWS